MVGDKIGDYELLDRLGKGAAGVAWRARDTRTDERVALKLLNDDVDCEPDMQKRFVREVAVLEKLNHPGIVRHQDCGIHEGKLFFVMELVDSGTLEEVLDESGVLPWQEAAEVAMQACLALAHAHDAGVVHRDLKPANLFLTSSGHVKIGDFGLARDNERHRLTHEGHTVGTCRYMAPEQVRGEDELTGAVDLYAVGCLLHLMMTGMCPFSGGSVVEVFEHHLFTPPPRLDERAAECPTALADLVDCLLAKDSKDRPASAQMVADALKSILDGGTPEMLKPADGEEVENLTQRLKSKSAAPAATPNYWRLAIAVGVLAAIVAFVIFVAR